MRQKNYCIFLLIEIYMNLMAIACLLSVFVARIIHLLGNKNTEFRFQSFQLTHVNRKIQTWIDWQPVPCFTVLLQNPRSGLHRACLGTSHCLQVVTTGSWGWGRLDAWIPHCLVFLSCPALALLSRYCIQPSGLVTMSVLMRRQALSDSTMETHGQHQGAAC